MRPLVFALALFGLGACGGRDTMRDGDCRHAETRPYAYVFSTWLPRLFDPRKKDCVGPMGDMMFNDSDVYCCKEP
jgi:hypothetical protein